MIPLRPSLTALVTLTATLALATPAAAQPRHARQGPIRGYEFSPYLVFVDFEEELDLDDEIGAGFRFGYLYNPYNEIEFLVEGVSTNDTIDPFIDVDVTTFQFAYVHNFTRKDVVPYFTAGLGFIHTEDAVLGDETDPALALGLGIRFFLGRSLFARFEGRGHFFEGDLPVFAEGNDVVIREFAFGIGWRFRAP
jgi:outer membrane protein with beta-barrel domain